MKRPERLAEGSGLVLRLGHLILLLQRFPSIYEYDYLRITMYENPAANIEIKTRVSIDSVLETTETPSLAKKGTKPRLGGKRENDKVLSQRSNQIYSREKIRGPAIISVVARQT